MRLLMPLLITALLCSCTSQRGADKGSEEPATAQQATAEPSDGEFAEPTFGTPVEPGSDVWPGPGDYRKAVFAGGCFWCLEKPFDRIPGVVATVSGYIGGKEREPTYRPTTTRRSTATHFVMPTLPVPAKPV